MRNDSGLTLFSRREKGFTFISQRERAFTLIELLIVMGSSAIVGSLLVTFLVQNNGVFFQQSSKASQGIAINNIVDEIKSQIRQANAVAPNYPAASPFQYTTNASTLVLTIPSLDSSGNNITNTNDYVVVTKDAQKPLILKEFIFPDIASTRKSVNRVLSTNLSLITFDYRDSNGNTVAPSAASAINFTVNELEKAGISNQQSSASAQVSLRNN